MVRRQFLKACAAAAAAIAADGVALQVQGPRGAASADALPASGPYKINLPLVANRAQMSGGNVFTIPFAVDFLTLPNGPLPGVFHAPTWSVQRSPYAPYGEANNYPALASQLHLNGNMEASNPTSGYFIYPGTTATVSANNERPGGVGTQSQQLQLSSSATSGGSQVNPVVTGAPGDWFHTEVWMRNGNLTAGQGLLPIVSAADGTTLASGSFYSGAGWASQVLTAQNPSTGIVEHVNLGGAGSQYGFLDDFFCYKLAPKDLMATLKGVVNYSCSVRANDVPYSGQFGLVLNLDNPTNPLNYLLVWFDRMNNRVVVDQYLNGQITNLLSAPEGDTFAYLALTAVKNGSALDIYWGGVKLTSSPLAVNPALVNNVSMGFMSPYQGGIIKYNLAPALVSKNILYVGDSKLSLQRSYPGVHKNMTGGALLAVESPARLAFSGWSSLTMYQNLDSLLNSAAGTPDFIFYNLGANDEPPGINPPPTQAQWTLWTSTNLDKLHAKWPSAQIYVARAWTSNYPALADQRAQWTAAILSTRSSWAFPGPDERVYLENGDNGATMTEDGVHYSPLGEYRTAQEWRKVLGYE